MGIFESIRKMLGLENVDSEAEPKNCLVIGAKGEVGSAIVSLLKIADNVVFERDYEDRMDGPRGVMGRLNIDYMHYCIPFNNQKEFVKEFKRYFKIWNPKFSIIHSTVIPGTTEKIIKELSTDCIAYSPCRGQHDNLYGDFKRYDKWIAFSGPDTLGLRDEIEKHLRVTFQTRVIGTVGTKTLEMSKLLDTSQYGILIMYAQIANRICIQHGISYDEVRHFMSNTHELYGNRPDIFPGYAGGHCVRQNLDLLEKFTPNKLWKLFKESNKQRKEELKPINRDFGV